jgi:DNA-binding beta-propeller fold protein YncE
MAMRRRIFLLTLAGLPLAGCGVAVSAGAVPSAGASGVPLAQAGAAPLHAPATATRAPAQPRDTQPSAAPTAFPSLVAGRPYVYVVDYANTIRVVDPQMARMVGALPVGWGALPVFSPDGSRLCVAHHPGRTGGQDARLDVLDVAGGRRLAGVGDLDLMSYKIWGPPILAPSRDGRLVYLHGRRVLNKPGELGRDTCWIASFDVAANRLQAATIPLPACGLAPLLLAADGRTLYAGASLVDLTAQPPQVRANAGLDQRAVAQSVDGRRLYALAGDGSIAVWDADARRVLHTWPAVVPAFSSALYLTQQTVQVSHAGTQVYVATDDGDQQQQIFRALLTLDAANGKRLGALRPARPFRTFAVSPDNAMVSLITPAHPAGSSGDTLDIWDLPTGTQHASVTGIGASSGPVLAPPPA